jgi:hypothetical protein
MGRTACTEPQCLYKGDLYQEIVKLGDSQSEIMEVGKNSSGERNENRGASYRVRTQNDKMELIILVNPIREVLKFLCHNHIFTKHTCMIYLQNTQV